jgi:DNA-binding CsgD family transcriptional regulator
MKLTPRESEVAALVKAGKSDKEVAVALDIGIQRAKNILGGVYRKLGIHSRRELWEKRIRWRASTKP